MCPALVLFPVEVKETTVTYRSSESSRRGEEDGSKLHFDRQDLRSSEFQSISGRWLYVQDVEEEKQNKTMLTEAQEEE
jgi:hypothetical protein